ncbi:MAG: hypothetical protein M0R03_18760 [Novosphingobium sp.]|nr:hypothetical protein [Novosphingobium sp.]
MDDYIPIKEFAEEVGLSKQAIYQRLEKDLKQFVKVENGFKSINTEALELFALNDSIKVESVEMLENTDNILLESVKESIKALKQQLETKDRQLETKDIQLSEKDKQISDLTTALLNEQRSAQQAQALHAGTITQNTIEETTGKKGLISKWFRQGH